MHDQGVKRRDGCVHDWVDEGLSQIVRLVVQ